MKVFGNRDRLGSLLVLCLALFYLLQSFGIESDPTIASSLFTPASMPLGLALCSIAVSLAQFVRARQPDDGQETLGAVLRRCNWGRFAPLTIAMLVYALAFSFLGFVVASILFLLVAFWILGERNPLTAVPVAVGLVLGLWLVLTRVFGVWLDPGVLLWAVGSANV